MGLGCSCVKVKKHIEPEIIYVDFGGFKFPAIHVGSDIKFLHQPDFSGFKTPRTALSVFSDYDPTGVHKHTFYNKFISHPDVSHPSRLPYYDSDMTLVVPDASRIQSVVSSHHSSHHSSKVNSPSKSVVTSVGVTPYGSGHHPTTFVLQNPPGFEHQSPLATPVKVPVEAIYFDTNDNSPKTPTPLPQTEGGVFFGQNQQDFINLQRQAVIAENKAEPLIENKEAEVSIGQEQLAKQAAAEKLEQSRGSQGDSQGASEHLNLHTQASQPNIATPRGSVSFCVTPASPFPNIDPSSPFHSNSPYYVMDNSVVAPPGRASNHDIYQRYLSQQGNHFVIKPEIAISLGFGLHFSFS